MITGARWYQDVAPVEVARGGILGAADVVPVSGHALLGAEYQTDACSPGHVWEEFCTAAGVLCPVYVPPATGLKDFDAGPSLVEGDPFAVYAGVECDLMRLDEARARAARALAYNERRLIDTQVMTWLAASSIPATDLGTAPSIAAALGKLENFAASVYGGPATILISIEQAAVACGSQLFSGLPGGALQTCQGSRVANIVTATGETTITATGRITLLQGPVITQVAPTMNLCDDKVSPPRALAERIYVPLVECFVAQVTVSATP